MTHIPLGGTVTPELHRRAKVAAWQGREEMSKPAGCRLSLTNGMERRVLKHDETLKR